MRNAAVAMVVSLVVVLAGASALAGTQPIKVFVPGSPPEPLVIDGSQPCYVAHGWVELESDVPDGVKPRDYLIENISLEIRIDDALIEPVNVVVRRLPVACSEYDEDAWRIAWTYRFPPRFFLGGTYTFTGTWHFPGEPPGGWSRSRDVIVVYDE